VLERDLDSQERKPPEGASFTIRGLLICFSIPEMVVGYRGFEGKTGFLTGLQSYDFVGYSGIGHSAFSQNNANCKQNLSLGIDRIAAQYPPKFLVDRRRIVVREKQ
jgi:hypothetical protein